MKYGNASWGLREKSLEEQMKITEKMGLSYLEIGIANAPKDIPLDIGDKEISLIKNMAKKYKIDLSYAATGNDFTVGDSDVDKIKKVIDICKKLGVKYLRIFCGFTPLEDMNVEIFEDMLKCLKKVSVYAKKKNISLCIETHGAVKGFDDGVMHIMSASTDINILNYIINDLPDNTGICFDPANIYACNMINIDEFYKKFEHKIFYTHFKDFEILPSGHLLPTYCGNGELEWEKLIKVMKDYDKVIMFEYENTEDVEEGLLKCYKFTSELFDRNIYKL